VPNIYSFQTRYQNLVGGWLAWAITLGANMQRKLLALEENVIVPDEQTGFFLAFSYCMC